MKIQGIPIEIVGTASDGNGSTCIDQKKENPNLVFLDIEMPGMNGFDVVEKSECCKFVRVIIITAYSTFSYAQRALRLGVSDIIEKPIDTDTLKEAIQRAIGWEFTGNEALNKALLLYSYALLGENRIGNTGGGSLLYPPVICLICLEISWILLLYYTYIKCGFMKRSKN